MPNRIHRSRALPLDLYADQAVFERELSRIWHQDWVFVAPIDAVAEPGQFVTATVGHQPIVVARGQDYTLRAVANVCSHRGARLVECDGRASRFSCPYHGWTYALDGELLSVPYSQSDEVDAAEHALATYRVESWHGLIFVSLLPDGPPLAETVQAIEPYVGPLGIDRLHHDLVASSTQEWQANWKITYANAVDSYSNFRVHPETVEPMSPTDASYYLAGSATATVTGGESADRADHVVIAVPPSFVAVVFADSMLWQTFTPISVDRTLVTTGFAHESVPVAEQPLAEQPVTLAGWDAGFVDEDRVICEAVQQNSQTQWEPGSLLQMERAIGDFHDYLAWRLADKTPAPTSIAAAPGERPDPANS